MLPQALACPSLLTAGKFGTFSNQSRMEQTFQARNQMRGTVSLSHHVLLVPLA